MKEERENLFNTYDEFDSAKMAYGDLYLSNLMSIDGNWFEEDQRLPIEKTVNANTNITKAL